MSNALPRERLDELCDLIAALHEKWITPQERARLEEYICHDEEACRVYMEYTHLYANLRWREMEEPEFREAPPLGETKSSRTPILGFLGDVFQAGTHFFSRGLVISLLLTIGLPGALFLILILQVARQPAPPAPVMPVATVTQMHECVYGEGSAPLPIGASLFSGQQVRLSEGLVKIVFTDGARVIIEGPSTFETSNRSKGFLHSGSLVANVPKGAEGFTIGTPSATVVDFGTEFGVAVEDVQGTAEVHVFQGEVALKTGSENAGRKPKGRHLAAGRAVRIESTDQKGRVVVREIASSAARFVRRLPTPAESANQAIIADFSGGKGNTRVKQFPGTAGSGWATGWNVREAEGIKCTVSIEQANPVLGGGDYLRVLAVRESGAASICRAIERRLALTKRVDLTKPHVVSFSFRIDVLGRFTKAGDHLIICNNTYSEAAPRKGPTSGWHIRVDGKDYEHAPARHWTFISGDGKGNEFRVSSGIPAHQGIGYSFRVLVDPQARRWTPAIAVSGGRWTTFRPMGMRSAGTAKDCKYWPFLYLYWMMEGGNEGADIEKIGFSVDSIRITTADANARPRGNRAL